MLILWSGYADGLGKKKTLIRVSYFCGIILIILQLSGSWTTKINLELIYHKHMVSHPSAKFFAQTLCEIENEV